MKPPIAIAEEQLEKFARFLEIHPGFYPELDEENASICGFRVGGWLLSIHEMDRLVSSQQSATLSRASLVRQRFLALEQAARRRSS
jgi:hypothetical protein